MAGLDDPSLIRRNFGLLLYTANYDGPCDYIWYEAYGNPWNDFDNLHYRDCNFVYPTVDGVIDTLSWEGHREAFDDVRYATTLRLAIANALEGGNARMQARAREAQEYLRSLDVRRNLDAIRSEMILKSTPINLA